MSVELSILNQIVNSNNLVTSILTVLLILAVSEHLTMNFWGCQTKFLESFFLFSMEAQ